MTQQTHPQPATGHAISPASIDGETQFSPPHAKTLNPAIAWFLLLFCGLAWGLTFSLAKIIADSGAHPLGINYWQSIIGAGILVSLSLITRQKIIITRHSILFFIACGLLGSLIPGVIYFYAASRVSPGILSITIASVPLITFTAAAFLGAEKLKISRVLGVIFGITSIIVLVAPNESLPDRSVIPWIFAALFSAFCYSSENLVVALKAPKGISPLSIATGLFVAAVLMMTPLVILNDAFVPMPLPWVQTWGAVEWALVGMAIVSVSAYSLYIYLIVRSGPVFASQTAYIVTISGVLWGIAIFDESHSAWIWASLAIMIAALALVTPRKNNAGASQKG